MIRRRLFLQLTEAQSTGLERQRPPPEIAARWRCKPLQNLTAHYKSQFCVSFFFIVSTGKPIKVYTLV